MPDTPTEDPTCALFWGVIIVAAAEFGLLVGVGVGVSVGVGVVVGVGVDVGVGDVVGVCVLHPQIEITSATAIIA
ncbi:MAG: hypothetical protein ACXVIG_07370 [Halobacteriota archaeon]